VSRGSDCRRVQKPSRYCGRRHDFHCRPPNG
jgi:hypothetical protein